MNIDSIKYDLITLIIDHSKEQGLSQKQLAELLGTSKTIISTIFNYHLDKISIDMLIKLANSLAIEMNRELTITVKMRKFHEKLPNVLQM